MTNDETSKGSAKPSIIDLEAEIIGDDVGQKPAEPQQPAAPPPKAAKRSTTKWLWPSLAVAVALVAGGWIYQQWLAGYFPTDAMQQANARIDTLEAQSKTLNDQLTALANQAEQLKGTTVTSQSAADSAAASAREASAKVTDVENRIAAVENAKPGSQGGNCKASTTRRQWHCR